MEKPATMLIVLLIAVILLSDNFLENTSEHDNRIAELEENNSEKEDEILALNRENDQLQHLVLIADARIANLLAEVIVLGDENLELESEIVRLQENLSVTNTTITNLLAGIPDPLEGCYLLEPEHTWAIDVCTPTIFILGENPANLTQNESGHYSDEGAICWNGTEWVWQVVEVSGQVVNLRVAATYEIHYNCGEAPEVTRIVNVVPQNSGGGQGGDGGNQGDGGGGQQGQG